MKNIVKSHDTLKILLEKRSATPLDLMRDDGVRGRNHLQMAKQKSNC